MRDRLIQASKKEELGSLTVFTALAPVSIGGLVGLLIIRGPLVRNGLDASAAALFILGLAALAFSLLHLGRPWRAPLAILHLSTSWLSREVILFSLFLITLLGYTILPVFRIQGQIVFFTGLTCAIVGMVATLATGKTYQLKSRPSWDHWSAFLSFPLGALTTGLLFGIFIEQVFYGTRTIGNPARMIIGVLLIFAMAASILRSVGRQQKVPELSSSRYLAEGAYLWVILIRIAAVLFAVAMLWLPGAAIFYAWIPALIAEFADRIIFFKTVIPVTLIGRYT